MKEIELTILMPCLNESRSLAWCIKEGETYVRTNGISAEIVVADNGSTDESPKIARECGARVVRVSKKGYGNALIAGIRESQGKYIIMGDCDGSYDFSQCGFILEKLREGYGLVVGNRYQGGIEKGAMPFLHRYLGVPLLSLMGRWRYQVEIGDFHCGIRGFDREKALRLKLQCGGMEFATEIIGKFARSGEKICQVPVRLRRDLRNGPSHLRAIPDGWRHVRLMLSREE
ncbi:glycosyltransferase family 2 protein [Lachnospiraceae bacterium 45-P1]